MVRWEPKGWEVGDGNWGQDELGDQGLARCWLVVSEEG